MKKIGKKGLLIVFTLIIGLGINTSLAQNEVSLHLFYHELQPYGTWIHHPGYGNVWLPRVADDFVPYQTNGYWLHTEYGNTWVSDYPWGWAPFHYGRWFFDDFYGWIWIPDTVWAPAWVVWRSGGGYYGWAPLMPGISINISVNYYSGIPDFYWNFVPCRYITYRHVYRHCVPRTQVVNVIHHTTIVNHNYSDNRRQTYFTGPSRSDIERTGNSSVVVHKINHRIRPGASTVENGELNLYRPEFDIKRNSRMSAAPERFTINNRDTKNLDSNSKFGIDLNDKDMSRDMRTYTPDRGQWNDNSKMNNGSAQNFNRREGVHQEKQDQNYPSRSFKNGQFENRSNMNRSVQKQNGNSWEGRNPQQQQRTYDFSQQRNQQMSRQPQQVERKSTSDFNRNNSQRNQFSPSKSGSSNVPQRSQSVQKSSSGNSSQSSKGNGVVKRSGR